MTKKGLALATLILTLVSLNGCCNCNRPRLLDRLRGKPATPSYSEPNYSTSMPTGDTGGGCCGGGGAPIMTMPGGGMPGGTLIQPPPGVTETPPIAPPGVIPFPAPGSPDQAKPMPAGPSGDMMKKAGRVTNNPDGK